MTEIYFTPESICFSRSSTYADERPRPGRNAAGGASRDVVSRRLAHPFPDQTVTSAIMHNCRDDARLEFPPSSRAVPFRIIVTRRTGIRCVRDTSGAFLCPGTVCTGTYIARREREDAVCEMFCFVQIYYWYLRARRLSTWPDEGDCVNREQLNRVQRGVERSDRLPTTWITTLNTALVTSHATRSRLPLP